MSSMGSTLRYVFVRWLIVVAALLIAACLMSGLRWAEAHEMIPANASKLGSIVYFHVASFGLLWCGLRWPFRWSRLILVALWLATDILFWIIVAAYDGTSFDSTYFAANFLPTLSHRYIFAGLAAAALLTHSKLSFWRVVHRSEHTNESSPRREDSKYSISILGILSITTYLAIGFWIWQSHQTNTQIANMDADRILSHLNPLELYPALWSVLRGLAMWWLTLSIVGFGRLNFTKILVCVAILPAVNLGLLYLQQVLQMSDDTWTLSQPYRYATKVHESLPVNHGIIASMLTFVSVLTARFLGYEWRSIQTAPLESTSKAIASS